MQSICPKCGSPAEVEIFRSGRSLGKLKDRALIRCSRNQSKGKPRCKVAACPIPTLELATAADQVEVQPERPAARVRLRQVVPAPRQDQAVVACCWVAEAVTAG